MNILSSTKNISETINGYGIIIAIHGDNEKWLASFEEDADRNICLDASIKVLHQVGDQKTSIRSYKEFNVTKELVEMLDKVISLWDNAPNETKKVLAF